MEHKFIYNVANIDKNYNFEIYYPSSLNNPKNNSLLFINKLEQDLIDNLPTLKEAVIIVKEKLDCSALEANNLIIFSSNPRLEYTLLLTKILTTSNKQIKNSKLNFKDGYYYKENVILGNNVIIEPFVLIGNNVTIGDNTVIKSGVKIDDNVKIGDNCYVGSNSVIGEQGLGFEKNERSESIRIPHLGSVIIGNHVEVGSHSIICRGTINDTIIEDFVKIDDQVHIAHNCLVGMRSVITAGVSCSGSANIGKDVYIAPNATIINGCSLGDNSFIGMGATTRKKIPANSLVIKWGEIYHKEIYRT